MNEENTVKIHKWLLPFAALYGTGVRLRNRLFDWEILSSENFPVPVISVGNITVGGTGKTPHTEYLIHLLSPKYKIAILSRGYKRKTKGFRIADDRSTSIEIGDEPFQMKRKFPNVVVAVDANRRRGINKLLELYPDIEVILLDDAFQHRYVTPSTSILLTDFNRLIYEDKLLPAGRLREPISGKNRASIVIVTKCPKGIKPIDFRIITKHLQLYPYQRLYFSTFAYGEIIPLFNGPERTLDSLSCHHNVLIVSGIASPETFEQKIKATCTHARSIAFGDHHNFTAKDIAYIKTISEKENEAPVIIVTEKDAARLIHQKDIDERLRKSIYYLPLKVQFLQGQGIEFDHHIFDTVMKNSRNYIPRTTEK